MRYSNPSSEASSKTASKPGNSVRLNKFLSDSGLCSRRQADEYIGEGRIMLNGEPCTDHSVRIDPRKDRILFDGIIVTPRQELKYIIINKPRGYPVTKKDEYGRKTVYSLLPKECQNYKYAGRLDMDSEGLLLLTNDGDMIQSLSHPRMKIEKVYRVDVNSTLDRNQLEQLRSGVMIEGRKTLSAGVFVKKTENGKSTLKIVITEGRKRQIRLMIEAVNARVLSLRRLQFGPLKLGDLLPGEWRLLNRGEIIALQKIKEKGQNKA